MAFGVMRSPRYTPLLSLDSEASHVAPSQRLPWMSSRRMRTLAACASAAIFLIVLSSFVDVPSRINGLSPQSLYGNFRDNLDLDSDRTETQPSTFVDSNVSPSSTKVSSVGTAQPTRTGNEPDLPNGDQVSSATSKPKSPADKPEATGNEPENIKIGDKPSEVLEAESAKSQAQSIGGDIDWTSFAYVQYVTNSNYLCNSLMILEALHRLGAKADRIMMYPEQWKVPNANESTSEEARFLLKARDEYKAKLVPIRVITFEDRGDETWKDSYTKLLAFNQTQYKRVISLDSDAIVQQTMDELFLLPSTPIAMPRAYWLDQPFLSSQLLVIEPSTAEMTRITKYMSSHPKSGFDMDILNTLYKNSALILPHRRYDLLTAEYRKQPNQHEPYLGTKERWNGTKVLEEAKFVHFSDWPVKKPWLADEEERVNKMPSCVQKDMGKERDCTDRDIWVGFYEGYKKKRNEICGREYDSRKRRSVLERRKEDAPTRFEYVVR